MVWARTTGYPWWPAKVIHYIDYRYISDKKRKVNKIITKILTL